MTNKLKKLANFLQEVSSEGKEAGEKLAQFKESLKEDRIQSFQPQSQQKLTLRDIDNLKLIYSRKPSERYSDFKEIRFGERIVKFIPFFMNFDSDVKFKILRNCELCIYKRGQEIFQEDAEGDYMYVVLVGAVNVKKKMKDPISKEIRNLVRNQGKSSKKRPIQNFTQQEKIFSL